MKRFTGQVIIRDSGEKRDGKRLVMVVGILAVPEGFLESECQYRISGIENDGIANMMLDETSKTDVSAETRGNSLGHLVTLPIWTM
jgi:hypothetical protein